MSGSTTNLDLISASQASKEVTANALFDAVSPATIYGRRASTTTALTWGFYGGYISIAGTPTLIANGTVALTASNTNYVVASRATGAVSVSTATTNWNAAGYIRLYEIVAGVSSVTSYIDHRAQMIAEIPQAYDADLTTWAGVTPGTGVATALAVAVGSAGAPVVNGGALGTPSSGTVTNLTGTASININGTVGGTTPSTGAFTTLSASGNAELIKLKHVNDGGAATISWVNSSGTTLWTLGGGNTISQDELSIRRGVPGSDAIVAHFSSTGLAVTGTIKGSTTIGVGNATPSASGAGITFPATQSASSDVNTLDDYEEGAWTPAITFATPGTLAITYAMQNGVYTKVGRVVTAEFHIVIGTNNFTKGTASGQMYITGLPVASNALTLSSQYLDLACNATNFTASTLVIAVMNTTATSLTLEKTGVSGTIIRRAEAVLDASDFAATNANGTISIGFRFTYSV